MIGDAFGRLLLVEDNPGDALLITELLEGMVRDKDRVVHAACVAAAVAALRSQPIDVVLLDLSLPDGQGVECVRAVQQVAPGIAVVVLTGLDDEESALSCIDAGAQDYLCKHGVKAQPLRRAIRYAIMRVREGKARRRADELQVRLAAIVESSGDAIVSSTVEGVITSWNRGAEVLFGYPREDAIGRPVHEILRPVDLDGAQRQRERIAEMLQSGSLGEAQEVVRLRKDGAQITLSVMTSVLRNAAGEVIGLSAICRDVSALKRRDAELRERNEQLRQYGIQMRALLTRLNAVREEERTRIAREVHDQLGQLLTGFKMDLRWIGRRLESQASASKDQAIAARLQEAEKLVDLTVATVQRIAIELRPSALDALGLGAALRDEVRRFEQRTGIGAQVYIDANATPDPLAATELFRILQELLTNVTRHARATAVEVMLEAYDGGTLLRVEDNGVGMAFAAEQRPASLGLLGMCERAQALGGTVQFEKSPTSNRGTVATVRIPT